MPKWLQYYIGGGGLFGTPKSDYVICARPLMWSWWWLMIIIKITIRIINDDRDNINSDNSDVHFNLSVPANPWECLGNRSAVLQLGLSVAVQSILSSPHHCFFHQQHHHQQTSSSWLLWSSAATSMTIYTAICLMFKGRCFISIIIISNIY